jgi:hypothetical protein
MHVLMCMWHWKLVLCISYIFKYLQNKAREQKSVKEITLQFSTIFQIGLKNNTVNFRDICPLIKSIFQLKTEWHGVLKIDYINTTYTRKNEQLK